MSKIPDSQVVNVEDDEPVPAGAAPVVAAPVVEPPPVDAPDEDLTDPDIARDATRVSGLLAELSPKRHENKERKAKAARVDDAEQFLAEHRPYVEFLLQNPGFLQQRPAAPVEPVMAKPIDDPRAVETAKLMDFWTPEGQPDAVRGAHHLRLVREEAQQITARAMQPLEQQTLQERSNQNYLHLLQMKDPEGRQVSDGALRAVFTQVLQDPGGLKITSDPRAAQFLWLTALGAEGMLRKPGVAAPGREPVVTEPSGGQPRPSAKVSAMEEKVMKNTGTSAASWQEQTKHYQPGRANILEDD